RRPSGLGTSRLAKILSSQEQKLCSALPRLSASEKSLSPFTTRDPEGGAQGCAPFFDRAMDGESKNPDSNESMGLLRRGKRFSLVRFFWGLPKEMNSAA
ncbi:hypothetical protein, partial [Luteimonas panaciterrae]|uniref:hypothetical protein n=1 Tax=Luteimonas panaciterrae TaxID=363885 RepID=UPI001CFA6454